MHSIPEIDVDTVKSMMDDGQDVFILDVREEEEYELTNIGGMLLPLAQLPSRLNELSDRKDDDIVVMCRTGGRSAQAVAFLLQSGFSKAVNMKGGVHAWSSRIDSSVIRY